MEKQWWYIRVVQAQLLLILLSAVQPVLAKSSSTTSIKKGKASASTKPHPSSQAAKKSPSGVKTSTAVHSPVKSKTVPPSSKIDSTKRGRRQLSKHAPAQTEKRTAQAARFTKKGGKKVAARASVQVSKSGRARTRSRFAAAHARSRRRSVTAFSRESASVTRNSTAETHRVLLDPSDDMAELLTPYTPELAPFPAQLNEERLAYRINSAFVLPGETLVLNVDSSRKKNEYILQTALATTQLGPNTWSWKAPQTAGVYPVKILHTNWGAALQLNVIVLIPFDHLDSGEINGYHIGRYPSTPTRQLSYYMRPPGFIEVTEANEQTFVSPHFRLRQFLCKQESSYPKYIVLDPRLLVVLETILKKVNEKGFHTSTLSIMSGYRTPYYNRAIGNSTTYSRHLWGDAADIFVDANPRDGEMDDLNRDGEINFHDTEVLYNIVFDLYEPRVQRFLAGSFFNEPILRQLVANGYSDDQRLQRLLTGGLARYRETGSHGPFVHVDVRGIFTRWGR